MNDQGIMLRKEEAGEKARRIIKRDNLVEHEIIKGDILIKSGIYNGFMVKDLWSRGSTERDFITKYLWFSGNKDVVDIINSLTCK